MRRESEEREREERENQKKMTSNIEAPTQDTHIYIQNDLLYVNCNGTLSIHLDGRKQD